MFDIAEELKKLPEKPGVYLMKDAFDDIIYVGKAINLKNRVRQYFQKSSQHSTKVRSMVAHIKEFEYIVTDNELEALILECNLIKKYRPKYNVLLRDDKTYPYIKVTTQEMFPRVFMTREIKKDGAKYFGPYTSTYAIRETIELIQKIFPIRDCKLKFPKDIAKQRPCLQYHIGQCIGPCTGKIQKEEYMRMITSILQFLAGKQEEIINQLEREMQEAAKKLEFEKAAEIRNKIFSIQALNEKQKISNTSLEDQDVIAFARAASEAVVQVFFVRAGKIIGREHYFLQDVEEMSKEEVITEFIKEFYEGDSFVPKEILLQYNVLEQQMLEQWLTLKRGSKVHLKVPQKGEKLSLVEMVAKNALLTLEQFGEKLKREERQTQYAIEELRQILGLDYKLQRIEAYDISNLQGVDSVGSMVVFQEGKPKKREYRKFKIQTVIGPNDYSSLEEVLKRRFSRAMNERAELKEANRSYQEGKFSNLPDIILMDGGKGQVNIAKKVLEEFGLPIDVAGMVKDDQHRTRGLYFDNQILELSKNSEAFKFISRVQDEVHRFAITYHRSVHEKNAFRSILDDIKNIGEKRKKALLKNFGSVEKIQKASLKELQAVDSMNRKSAEAVYEFFHKS